MGKIGNSKSDREQEQAKQDRYFSREPESNPEPLLTDLREQRVEDERREGNARKDVVDLDLS
jgi:hypothetical protein